MVCVVETGIPMRPVTKRMEAPADFCRKSVHGFHAHHLVAEGADDPPASGPEARCHDHGAGDFDPCGHFELRRMQEAEPSWQFLQLSRLRGRKKGQRDDAHRLLRIGKSVGVAHVGSTHNLKLREDGVPPNADANCG